MFYSYRSIVTSPSGAVMCVPSGCSGALADVGAPLKSAVLQSNGVQTHYRGDSDGTVERTSRNTSTAGTEI